MVSHMRKRVILPGALRAIRVLKSEADTKFQGGHFGPACLISHGALANIEAGRRAASEALIERLADQLGVPIDAISYMVDVPMAAAS